MTRSNSPYGSNYSDVIKNTLDEKNERKETNILLRQIVDELKVLSSSVEKLSNNSIK
jgi:hypothetical protein